MENVDFLVSSANKCLQVFRIMRSLSEKIPHLVCKLKNRYLFCDRVCLGLPTPFPERRHWQSAKEMLGMHV